MNPDSPLVISAHVTIPPHEIEMSAMRAQGPGGQNVNKVSSSIHLSFDIKASSLPDFHKERLLQLRDQRLTKEGVIIIKSQEHRSQEKNQSAALERLRLLIVEATKTYKIRRATKPTKNSTTRRLDFKSQRGEIKSSRKKWDGHSD